MGVGARCRWLLLLLLLLLGGVGPSYWLPNSGGATLSPAVLQMAIVLEQSQSQSKSAHSLYLSLSVFLSVCLCRFFSLHTLSVMSISSSVIPGARKQMVEATGNRC